MLQAVADHRGGVGGRRRKQERWRKIEGERKVREEYSPRFNFFHSKLELRGATLSEAEGGGRLINGTHHVISSLYLSFAYTLNTPG